MNWHPPWWDWFPDHPIAFRIALFLGLTAAFTVWTFAFSEAGVVVSLSASAILSLFMALYMAKKTEEVWGEPERREDLESRFSEAMRRPIVWLMAGVYIVLTVVVLNVLTGASAFAVSLLALSAVLVIARNLPRP